MLIFGVLLYLTVGPLSARIEAAGVWLAEHVGLGGVFLYVYIVDAFIVPASVDLLFPLLSSWSYISVVAVLSGASVVAGLSGFLIGRSLNRVSYVNRLTTRYRTEHGYFLVKYGRRTVMLAALLPIPFSTTSWIAGSLDMSIADYLTGALFRIPRMAITLWMFRAGVYLFG